MPAASTPATIAITLTQTPAPSLSLWENGTVWVAAFALFGALATATITVWFAHIRMQREISEAARNAAIEREQTRTQAALDRDHTAGQARLERLTVTRRQVYLDAVEALGKAQMFLGSMAKQDMASLDFQGNMGPLLVAVNRVAVVGEMQTVRTARELVSKMNHLFFHAMVQLMPMALYRGRVASQRAEWEATQVEIKRILAAMTNHNETATKDPEAFAALMRSFEAQQQRAKDASASEQKAQAGIIRTQMEYGEFVMAGAAELALHLDVLVDSVRRELEIETDFDEFRAQTEQIIKTVSEAMAEMRAGLAKYQADVRDGKFKD